MSRQNGADDDYWNLTRLPWSATASINVNAPRKEQESLNINVAAGRCMTQSVSLLRTRGC
jgi:hypothetical protein